MNTTDKAAQAAKADALTEARVTQRLSLLAQIDTAYSMKTNPIAGASLLNKAIRRFEAEVTQSATAPLIEAIEAATKSIMQMQSAFRRYEMDVDADAPPEHRDMMADADQTLTALTAALAQHRGDDT